MGSVFTVFVWISGTGISLAAACVLIREIKAIRKLERAQWSAERRERHLMHLIEDDISRAEYWKEADLMIEAAR